MYIQRGACRELTKTEKCHYPDCKYVVTTEYQLRCSKYAWNIVVPRGFVCDGMTFGPDVGCSWIFHDYLYVAQEFSDKRPCTKREADRVMKKVLKEEKRYFILFGYTFALKFCKCIMKRAWNDDKWLGVRILDL